MLSALLILLAIIVFYGGYYIFFKMVSSKLPDWIIVPTAIISMFGGIIISILLVLQAISIW